MKTRRPNAYDIYFVTCTNTPNGREITFDFYPTDDELHDILSLTIQWIFSVDEKIAEVMLTYSTLDKWARLMSSYSYVDKVIDKVMGGDLYEIYYEQEH